MARRTGAVTSPTSLPSPQQKTKRPPYKFKKLTEIPMAKATVEDIINEEISRFLRATGMIPHNESVVCNLPGPDPLILSVKARKQSDEERLVFEVL